MLNSRCRVQASFSKLSSTLKSSYITRGENETGLKLEEINNRPGGKSYINYYRYVQYGKAIGLERNCTVNMREKLTQAGYEMTDPAVGRVIISHFTLLL